MAEVLPFPAKLDPARVQLAQHMRRVFHATVPDGTAVADALRAEFWTTVAPAHRLQPLDRIEICDDRVSYFVEAIVVDVHSGGVVLRPLRGFDLEAVGAPGRSLRATSERVEYKGPHRKWCVLRADVVLRDGFATEALAGAWLADLLKAHR